MNHIRKVLLVSKITGLENLKINLKTLDSSNINLRSTHYQKNLENLIKRHNEHQKFIHCILENIKLFNKELKIVKKNDYDDNHANWADLIVSAGGDGTFLNASSRVHNNEKLIVGINTDPSASTGHLCLKNVKCSDIKEVLGQIFNNHFETINRARIRTLICNPSWIEDFGHIKSLHSKKNIYSENIFSQALQSDNGIRLNLKALNEVYAGENSSAKVSQYEIKIDNEKSFERQKSSGVILYTGTGSSSWANHVNRISSVSIREIVNIMRELNLVDNTNQVEDEVIDKIRKKFNQSLIVPVDSTEIGFIIRDGVQNSKFKITRDRGFGSKISLISMMQDGFLAIDGAFGVPFNNGTKAEFSIHPEDSLKCIANL